MRSSRDRGGRYCHQERPNKAYAERRGVASFASHQFQYNRPKPPSPLYREPLFPPPSPSNLRLLELLQELESVENNALARLLDLAREEDFVEDRVDFVKVEDEVLGGVDGDLGARWRGVGGRGKEVREGERGE